MRRGRSVAGAVLGLLGAGALGAGLGGCSLLEPTSSPMVPQAAPASSASVAARPSVPAATALATAPVPPVVPGYSLGPPRADVVRQFQSAAGKVPGVFSGLTVRTVSKGSIPSGFVVLLGLHPDLVGNTLVEQSLLPGLLKGMAGDGAKASLRMIGDVDAATATTRTASFLGWYRTGTVVLVLNNTPDLTPTLAFAQAYLAAR